MEHYYHTLEGENWFDYEGIYMKAVIEARDGDVFVELGSWKGKSSVFMAVEIINSGKKIEFYCVDDWSQGETRNEFMANIEQVQDVIHVIASKSDLAASLFLDNSVRFCFVDAGHDYESKTKDVKAWLPKIKNGGTIAGHDYTPAMDEYNKTYDAVNDVIGKENIRVIKNVWIYEKP